MLAVGKQVSQTNSQGHKPSVYICALENKINLNISMSSDPWKSVRQRVFPCTAAETIGRTNLLIKHVEFSWVLATGNSMNPVQLRLMNHQVGHQSIHMTSLINIKNYISSKKYLKM